MPELNQIQPVLSERQGGLIRDGRAKGVSTDRYPERTANRELSLNQSAKGAPSHSPGCNPGFGMR